MLLNSLWSIDAVTLPYCFCSSSNRVTPVVAAVKREPDYGWNLQLEAGPCQHLAEGGLATTFELLQSFLASTEA